MKRNENKSISKIKTEMKSYRDFYGGDIPDTERIDKCADEEELKQVLNDHERLLEDMLADALSHLNNFRKRLFYPELP